MCLLRRRLQVRWSEDRQLYSCVYIVGRLYRPSCGVKHKTPSGATVKNISLYAVTAGQGKIYVHFINLYIMLCLSRTVVILCYVQK